MKRIFLAAFVLSGCNTDFEVKELSEEVRREFKEHLKANPKVPYYDLLGRKGSRNEANLGRMLFNDPILSRNNDVSCATCHLSNHGFADGNRLPMGALGHGGPTGDNVGDTFAQGVLSDNRVLGDDSYGYFATKKMFRNSLSTVNVAHRANKEEDSGLLWDGRFGDLKKKVLLPIHTKEELCGSNPLSPNVENIFRKGGPLFREPVEISDSVFVNPYSGKGGSSFTGTAVTIYGIPLNRENGSLTYPNRNECLALAIAKINSVPMYKRMFKDVYGADKASDKLIASALAMFVSTHTSTNSRYDQFVQGKNSLSRKELIGLGVFMKPYGEEFKLAGKKYRGAGCASCHTPPLFESENYYSLGVKSDPRSVLSSNQFQEDYDSGFFHRKPSSVDDLLKCRSKERKSDPTNSYAPDIGRASVSTRDDSCFKFRVPSLKNVIATYPYFHHGTEYAQSFKAKSIRERSVKALSNVIDYHLRGRVDIKYYQVKNFPKQFFDPLFQRDPMVPLKQQSFGFLLKKIEFSKTEKEGLLQFVASGLEDEEATQVGDLGNDVSHPRSVPSGLSPTITRDKGTQYDVLPNAVFRNNLRIVLKEE